MLLALAVLFSALYICNNELTEPRSSPGSTPPVSPVGHNSNMPGPLDLPYCAGCLQDFSPAQAPCAFSCGHLYCPSCLPRLTDGHGSYKCLFDGNLSPEGTVHCDIELGHSIEKVRNGFEVDSGVLSRGFNESNLQLVTCRAVFQSAACPRQDICPFSHASKSTKISQRFLGSAPPCWECQDCLLTISHNVGRCPVCDCDRDKAPQNRASIREAQAGTNVTLDQSMVTEEERPKIKKTPMSLSEQMTPIEETLKHDEPVRSACCLLQ